MACKSDPALAQVYLCARHQHSPQRDEQKHSFCRKSIGLKRTAQNPHFMNSKYIQLTPSCFLSCFLRWNEKWETVGMDWGENRGGRWVRFQWCCDAATGFSLDRRHPHYWTYGFSTPDSSCKSRLDMCRFGPKLSELKKILTHHSQLISMAALRILSDLCLMQSYFWCECVCRCIGVSGHNVGFSVKSQSSSLLLCNQLKEDKTTTANDGKIIPLQDICRQGGYKDEILTGWHLKKAFSFPEDNCNYLGLLIQTGLGCKKKNALLIRKRFTSLLHIFEPMLEILFLCKAGWDGGI